MIQTTIISSFAQDTLLGKKRIIQEGGPALFISNFLKEKGIPYKIYSGEKGLVEIDMKEEKGRIISVGEISVPPKEKAELVLISTLLREFELKAFGKFCCLDLQGYVRNGENFGEKKEFDSPELEKFDVIKATEEEIRYIPKERVKKMKLIVITKGDKGFEIVQNKKRYKFSVEKIRVTDTIGAGDTFFTAFCVKYYETKNISESAEFAVENTNKFLLNKQQEV